MKKITIFFIMFFAVLAVSAQSSDKLYDGKIGTFNIKVNVDFSAAVSAEVGDSLGYYYYTDRPNIKMTLRLKQIEDVMNETTFRVSYHVVLDEYTPKGFNSGTFDGWIGALNYYNGTFTNSQKKEYEFFLTIDE